ncbi:Rv3654c family TadE-like protein [Demequina sp.]|uniref:Rv3654c family TadE-like protein n=1 Tax=Demequina sp. TaxID=2050685 RepID=UPI0025C534D3|nr:Rv3654c family TadE-like protein [Demequina sp.]
MTPVRMVARKPHARWVGQARLERGSATPLVVGVIAVMMVIAAALAQVGAGLIADARASGAADLAALAAAGQDRDLRAEGVSPASSLTSACRVAKDVSGRNAATLTGCVRGAGSSVVVAVRVTIPGWPTAATARARAGSAWG